MSVYMRKQSVYESNAYKRAGKFKRPVLQCAPAHRVLLVFLWPEGRGGGRHKAHEKHTHQWRKGSRHTAKLHIDTLSSGRKGSRLIGHFTILSLLLC